jgi:phage-related protein
VGLSFLPGIASSVATIATRFGTWLQQIVASGQAADWISNALATLRQLGGVLSNVGGILKSVFSAASAAGSGFLGVIGQALASLNQFLKTAAGKSALQGIFQGLAAIGQSLSPVIGALVQGLGQLAGPIGLLAQLLGPILTEAITALAPALAALEPGLIAVFQGLGSAVTFLAPALVPLAKALASIGIAIAPILPVVGQLAALLAQQLAASIVQITSILGPVIAALAVSLAPVLPQLATAFAQVARAMAPIATQLGQQLAQALAQALPPLLAIIPQLLNGLLPAFTQLLVQMTPLMPQLIQLGVILANNLATSLPPLIPPLIQLVQLMVEWSGIMVPVLGWILSISAALAGPLGSGVTTAVQVIAWGINLIFGWFQWLYDVLLGHSVIPDIVNGTIIWFSSLPGRVIGFFASMASGAVSQASNMLKSLSGIPGSIINLFSGAGSWLYNAGRNIVVGLWNGVVSLWNWLAAGFRRLTNLIPSWKGPPAKDKRLLTPAGVAIMQGLGAGIASQIPALRSTLAGVTGEIAGLGAPAGVTAMAGAGAAGSSVGIDAKTLAAAVKAALHGTTVQMDSKPVGQIVSRQLGQATDLRRRTG